MPRCLGRLPHHPGRLAGVTRFAALPPLPIPGPVDWIREHPPGSWDALGNLTVGDCTAAGVGHAIDTWGFTSPPCPSMTLTDALALYSATSPYPAVDRGALCLDVLEHWRAHPQAGVSLSGFCSIDPRNHLHVRQALLLFGGVYAGVTLRQAQQTQAVWDIGGDGSEWGGHCIWIAAGDDDGMTCITWGETQRLTWRWWDQAADEAYGLVSPMWRSPLGISTEALVADMQALA